MSPTRTYFIRTRNRSRILETLICQIVDGKLAFGLARAPASDSSPSRKQGRADATKRLEAVLKAYANGNKFVYRSPHAKRDDPALVNTLDDVMGGILPVEEVVPTLYRLLLSNIHLYPCVPSWALNQDEECLGNVNSYHDMLCKLRNCVEAGKF